MTDPPTLGGGEPQREQYAWLLWAGVAALGAGLALAGGTAAVRMRR